VCGGNIGCQDEKTDIPAIVRDNCSHLKALDREKLQREATLGVAQV
jgi:hypothetical protein